MFKRMWWRGLRQSMVCVALACAGSVVAQSLPAPVEAALARAQIPRDAVSVYIAPVEGRQPVRLAWRRSQNMVK